MTGQPDAGGLAVCPVSLCTAPESRMASMVVNGSGLNPAKGKAAREDAIKNGQPATVECCMPPWSFLLNVLYAEEEVRR